MASASVLASSTCSFDLPGARATWSNDDRLVYTFASRAPWLFGLMFAKFIHDVRRDPAAIFPMMQSLGPADQEILGREDFRQMFAQNVAEAFRLGGRGPALEARPRGVPLGQIQVPIEIWHGEYDRLVSPQASRILAAALPGANTHRARGGSPPACRQPRQGRSAIRAQRLTPVSRCRCASVRGCRLAYQRTRS